jgi:hypothetical protein
MKRIAGLLVSMILVTEGLASAQNTINVTYPEGTLFLLPNSKGAITIIDRKEALKADEDIKKFLASEYKTAAEKARKGKDKTVKPLLMVRVREKVDIKRVELLRTFAREAGFRTGLDLDYVEKVIIAEKAPPAGTVVVQVKGKNEYVVPGKKKPLGSVEELTKYLEKEQPKFLKAVQQATGKDAKPRIQLTYAKVPDNLIDLLKATIALGKKGYGITEMKLIVENYISTSEKKFELDK